MSSDSAIEWQALKSDIATCDGPPIDKLAIICNYLTIRHVLSLDDSVFERIIGQDGAHWKNHFESICHGYLTRDPKTTNTDELALLQSIFKSADVIRGRPRYKVDLKNSVNDNLRIVTTLLGIPEITLSKNDMGRDLITDWYNLQTENLGYDLERCTVDHVPIAYGEPYYSGIPAEFIHQLSCEMVHTVFLGRNMIYLGNLELPRSPENNLYLALLHYEDLFTQDHSWLKSLKHWVGEENIMPVPAAALVNTDPVDQKAILLAVVVFFYYQISSADFRDEEVFAQVDRIFRAEQLNHKKELRDMAKENEPQMCPKVKKEEPQMCPEVKEEEPQMCPEVKKEEHQMSPAVKNLIIRLLDKA